eukprot:CAMPEP_0179234408 /NCGR_PEP_ID=MMETSP0797-20121207/12876_1 /TAXON_ID=47934 /ORGANISM="Dinophysis acuminata, Strain DAEP01" /LENGTH=232 /DNA_ID=CAMNT_0020941591 /DNA_START=107 /DNA_END=801 /DNA_ORIENTATION=+
MSRRPLAAAPAARAPGAPLVAPQAGADHLVDEGFRVRHAIRGSSQEDAPLARLARRAPLRVLGDLDAGAAVVRQALHSLAAAADDRPDDVCRHHQLLREQRRGAAAAAAALALAVPPGTTPPLATPSGDCVRSLLLGHHFVQDVVGEAHKLHELASDRALLQLLKLLLGAGRKDSILQPDVHDIVGCHQRAAVGVPVLQLDEHGALRRGAQHPLGQHHRPRPCAAVGARRPR